MCELRCDVAEVGLYAIGKHPPARFPLRNFCIRPRALSSVKFLARYAGAGYGPIIRILAAPSVLWVN